MSASPRVKGRPGRYSMYDQFEASLPDRMSKRPLYYDGIGLFKGSKSNTVWIKITLPRGGEYRGRRIPSGGAVEIKLGNRSSWNWQQLINERDRVQGLADRGEPLEETEVPTFASYALDWLERKKPILKGYGTTKGHVEAVLLPAFGRKGIDAITTENINRWIGKQRARLKPATVQRQFSTLNAILNSAVRDGTLDRNPAERADRLKGIEPRQRFVTQDEWQMIVETAEAIEAEHSKKREIWRAQKCGWLRHYIMWAYHSGMRRSEILGLQFQHIRKMSDGHTVAEVSNTKSGKPRFVTCTSEMVAIISELENLERLEGDERLFPVSLTTLKRSLTALWRRTGLQDVRLHDLRRTHATILIQRNIDPRTVAGRLGHSGTAMLAKHYAVDLGDIAAAKAFG